MYLSGEEFRRNLEENEVGADEVQQMDSMVEEREPIDKMRDMNSAPR